MPLAASIFYGIARVEPAAIGAAALGGAVLVVLTTYDIVRPWTRLGPTDLLRIP